MFNKVLYPHLETTNSFEGIIIPHLPLCCLSFKQCERGCGITRKISFEGIVGLPIVDQFNKGGNCKLQGGLFIFIGKFSMGIFNIGGNCKLQFPQMKGGCVTLTFFK